MTTEDFAIGLDLAPQTYLYCVRGQGKVAFLWARDKGHARERFAADFFVGISAESCRQV